ncbi:hypothetical protein BC829DRAFT_442354 [Chytridium lagenaria]|nr:hypothetical protein BC829DRAFT_442354 [Chytridium lagenaria]
MSSTTSSTSKDTTPLDDTHVSPKRHNEAIRMYTDGQFTIPTQVTIDNITRQAVQAMSTDSIEYLHIDRPFTACTGMARTIEAPPNLPDGLLQDYSVSDISPTLSDMMLQRRGLSDTDGTLLLRLCSHCKLDLIDTKPPKLPVNSIRNGNIHRPSTGNIQLIDKNTAGPLTALIPRDITNLCRVTFVGSFTPRQLALTKRHVVPALPDVPPEAAEGDRDFDTELATHHVPSTSLSSAEADPSLGDPRLTSFVLTQTPCRSDPLLLVRHSNITESSWEWHEVIKIFPTLFPYGRGGPGEHRTRRLTLLQWIRRSLRVYGRRFPTHYAFSALAYDKISTQAAYRSLSCSMKIQRTNVLESTLSSDVIEQALREIETFAVKSRHGILNLSKDSALTIASVESLRRGVQAGEQTFPGSNASSARGRREGFAAIRRLGQAHVFLTLTPNATGSYYIGVLAGLVDPSILSAANAFLPSDNILKHAVRNNAYAAASYFLRCLTILIDIILGFDRKFGKSKTEGGVLGHVENYICSVETTKSGDLHAHFVICFLGSSKAMTMCNDYHCRPRTLDAVWWASFGELYDVVDHKSNTSSEASPLKLIPNADAIFWETTHRDFYRPVVSRGDGMSEEDALLELHPLSGPLRSSREDSCSDTSSDSSHSAISNVDCILPLNSDLSTSVIAKSAYVDSIVEHVIFEHFARRLLLSFADFDDDYVVPPSSPSMDQTIMLACGLAGSGKSQVIMALLKFVSLWNRRSSIETTSFTGTAAMNIHDIRDFRDVKLIIIDEASMIDVKLFGAFEAGCRQLASSDDTSMSVMAGRHVLIFGDFLQLLPVAGTPYMPTLTPTPETVKRSLDLVGYDLLSNQIGTDLASDYMVDTPSDDDAGRHSLVSVRTPPVSPHIAFAEKVYGRPVKCALFVNDSVQNTNVLILASLSAMHKLWYPGEDNVEDFQRSILLLLDGRPSSKNIKTALNKIIDPDLCSDLDPSQFGYWPHCLSPHKTFQDNVTAVWDHWVKTWGPQRISLNSILNRWKTVQDTDTGKRKASVSDGKPLKKIRSSTSPGLSNAAFFYLRVLDSLLSCLATSALVDQDSITSEVGHITMPEPRTSPSDSAGLGPYIEYLRTGCPILMSHLTSIFAMTIESEVDNLTTTVANHYICVSSEENPGGPTSTGRSCKT